MTRRVCDTCGGSFDTPWPRQRYCDPCWHRRDIHRCPDGSEHKWEPVGLYVADSGPAEGGPYEVEKCRCGVGSVRGLPIENFIAATVAAVNRRRAA